ncbi:MAG: hypothetical protein VX257_04735, partial [Planctomycetota bacterium]|nr:hypothetical protein [Planctomycetota bacterium]
SLFAPKAKDKKPAEPQAKSPAVAATQSVAKSAPDKQDQRTYVMRLDVTPKDGESLEDAYFQYFNQNRVHPKVIRAKVRRVGNQAKYKEGVAIIRAALRSGQVQSWMYEGLGLMMKLADMPRDEIERTLMSAVDFASTAHELIHIADFLEHMRFRARALEVLQVVSQKAPGMTEPYVRGLSLAQHIKADEAIQWAALGILRQEWPQGKRKIRNDARRAAVAVLERMRKDGDEKAAEAFGRQVKEASKRDVVVRVSWVGEADLDLMIQEPSGTVCSFRHPRTSAGGVLVGDLNSKLDRAAGVGFSEYYVCPEGFDGTYRALIRCVWGRVPTGKATVEIWVRGNTKDQIYAHKVVQIKEKKASMVVFDLEGGRRTESLAEHQIANDVQTQLAVNRAILGQQINALADSSSLAGQPVSGRSEQPRVVGRAPIRDRNGRLAGFQPNMAIIPEGATLSVNAVISADRRYVRVTALPFFSHIKEVILYNLTSGIIGRTNSQGQAIDQNAIDGVGDLGGGGFNNDGPGIGDGIDLGG